MTEQPPRAGGLPVRRAASRTSLRWALPLLAVQTLVFLLLVLLDALAVLPALVGFLVSAGATWGLFWLLARNLETMGRWLVEQDDGAAGEPYALTNPVAADAIGGLMRGVFGVLHDRDGQIDHLVAEIGRMLDTLPDPLFMVSRARRVVRLNRAGRSLFGEAVLGQDVSRLVRSPALENAVDGALAVEAGDSIEITITAGQVERLFSVEVAPMPVAGNDGPAVMAMFHDITEIRRTEQMRVDFVANASHEIRSPLATLIGCIETLQGPARDDAEARTRFLEMMDDQGRRVARLVGDLLSLSRIELMEHAPPTGSVDIGAMLERLRASFRFQAQKKDMTLELILEEGLTPVRGDEGEVEQAIYNLISNAIKYGRRATVVSVAACLVERPPRHLRLVHGPLVWISVTDRGEGIAARHLPRLTERFYRIDTARSRELGGTGLGLAIVKHVLNRHRGELHVASKLGEGSTFTIWLPTISRS